VNEEIVARGKIEQKIFIIRDLKIMLDRDLAYLYGVSTKVLNQAVKRNEQRFPGDFMFQLTEVKKNGLVTNCDRFGRLKYSSALPYAFTEQGVSMLSSVLRSSRAIRVNIEIMRVFVRLRQMLATHKELAQKLEEHEQRIAQHDGEISTIFETIRQLMAPPEPSVKEIGFKLKEPRAAYCVGN